MNFINLILSIVLVIFICISGYFIKTQATTNIFKEDTFPEFYSTKYALTNSRTGPSTNYPIRIVYKIKNMPVKALQKHNEWLEIEDVFGNIGWIKNSLLLKKKTALIITENAKVYLKNNNNSKIIAYVKKVSIVFVKSCSEDTNLCKVTIEIPFAQNNTKYPKIISGWISLSDLWGGTL